MDKEIEEMMIEIDNLSVDDEEALNTLYARKASINSKISNYKTKLDILYRLREITNEAICSVQGHSFSEWKERLNKIATYYERKCSVCGKVERTIEKPDKYVSQEYKTSIRKVYSRKRDN